MSDVWKQDVLTESFEAGIARNGCSWLLERNYERERNRHSENHKLTINWHSDCSNL